MTGRKGVGSVSVSACMCAELGGFKVLVYGWRDVRPVQVCETIFCAWFCSLGGYFYT